MSESDPLTEARKLIDIIDDKMLDLLVQRARLSVVAARAKSASADDEPAIDQARENEILTRICERASEAGLDLCTTEDIFRAVLAFSRAAQK